MLKGTVICNCSHGPFQGAKNLQVKADAFESAKFQGLLDQWAEEYAHDIAFDRNTEDLSMTDTEVFVEEWLDSIAAHSRGAFVMPLS